ncbi:hypothetical protein Tco_0432761, partial [Tanacetum coccineum]
MFATSTQQDIYVAGSENCPPMLNKDNYVPWSSRLLCYAKSKPNRKLIYNSIMHGPYVRQMIPEIGDPDSELSVAETFHEQTDVELTDKEVKQMEAGDQAIRTILMGLPEDIYAAIDSLEVNELRAERLARTHDPLALMANSNNSYNYLVFHQDQPSQIAYMQQPLPNNNFIPQPSFNQNYMQQLMINPEDISDPTTSINLALVPMAKAFKLNYSTPTNNNQRISSNLRNRQIAQPGINMGQDRQMQMVVGNGRNQFRLYNGQNVRKQNGYNAVHSFRNQVVHNAVQNLAARAKGDLDEIEEVNENCLLIANLQQASTSGTQTDKAPVYDSDGLAE